MFSLFFSLGVPCILPVYFGLRPFAPFQYILLIKKKMYGSLAGGWRTRGVTGAYGVCLWKHIRRCWDVFYNFTRVEVGDGYRARF
jgi:hypothetical protein